VLTDGWRRDKCKQVMVFDPYFLMKEALNEAEKGFAEGEIPVGAVVADARGVVVATAHNQPVSLNDPTAHAEILALRSAGAACRNYRLEGAILVVTMEPCPMCMGAAVHARVARLIFGSTDPRWGAAGSVYNLAADTRLNHRIEVLAGIMEQDCLRMMLDFFHSRRMQKAAGEVPKWS
jgi:tRNA(adenine34) deaminase